MLSRTRRKYLLIILSAPTAKKSCTATTIRTLLPFWSLIWNFIKKFRRLLMISLRKISLKNKKKVQSAWSLWWKITGFTGALTSSARASTQLASRNVLWCGGFQWRRNEWSVNNVLVLSVQNVMTQSFWLRSASSAVIRLLSHVRLIGRHYAEIATNSRCNGVIILLLRSALRTSALSKVSTQTIWVELSTRSALNAKKTKQSISECTWGCQVAFLI